jgi:NAD(P)-dependent dehydrogenase (short-subunit alcohol dehydrogenase family)
VSELFSLAGETAVVTGALGRLGPIWIEGLLDAGARVAGLDRPGTGPSSMFTAVRQRFDESRLTVFDCDITNRDSLLSARDRVVAEKGVPKVLVNNAGIDQPPDSGTSRFHVEDMPVDLFRTMIEVNVTGTFQATQVFGALMTAHGGGSIINIGSLYASVSPDQRFYDHFPGDPPFIKVPAYGASKAAVVNMTKFFATMWGREGVRVNTLSPGGVLGGQDADFKRKYGERVPLGRMADAADLKGPLVFLASKASSYMTGQELRVDGGFTAW